MSFKSAIDFTGFFQRRAELLGIGGANASSTGVAGDHVSEPLPQYNQANCENVIQGQANNWIILGRDRPASRMSGYGGTGDTQASMIDICVGRMAWAPRSVDDANNAVYANPNFTVDSARIYISQKTDIDENFGLEEGNVGQSVAKSAIGLKADAVRIIAREGIKLVTRTDERNSQGGSVEEVVGIDLIAGNDGESLQPMPLGDNLEMALKRIIHHMDKLNGIVDSFLMQQIQFNIALTSHVHLVPVLGLTHHSPMCVASGISTVSKQTFTTKLDLAKHKANLKTFSKTYLSNGGAKYINSRYNKVN